MIFPVHTPFTYIRTCLQTDLRLRSLFARVCGVCRHECLNITSVLLSVTAHILEN